jgi:hypothetical protein
MSRTDRSSTLPCMTLQKFAVQIRQAWYFPCSEQCGCGFNTNHLMYVLDKEFCDGHFVPKVVCLRDIPSPTEIVNYSIEIVGIVR